MSTTQYIHYPDGSGGGGSSTIIIGSSSAAVTTDGTTTISLGSQSFGPGINILYVKSTGGPVTMAANPQLPAAPNGAILIVYCPSNTDTVRFVNGNGNDQNGGVTLNGNQAIQYWYEEAISTWHQVCKRA